LMFFKACSDMVLTSRKMEKTVTPRPLREHGIPAGLITAATSPIQTIPL